MAQATLSQPRGAGDASTSPSATVLPERGGPPPMPILAGDSPCCLLCLDLGTRTGWALHDDGQTFSGTVEFRPQRVEGGGMRYMKFRHWRADLASRTSVALRRAGAPGLDAVYFEEVRGHAGVDASHLYGGFLATLTAWCEQRSIPYEGVPVGTIKRHIAGKGNADKEAVIAAVRTRGFTPRDDNETDALALLHWVLANRAGAR